MAVFIFLATLYLIIGFVYAAYILIKGKAPWYYFLVNWIGGPIMILYVIYITQTGKNLPTEF